MSLEGLSSLIPNTWMISWHLASILGKLHIHGATGSDDGPEEGWPARMHKI